MRDPAPVLGKLVREKIERENEGDEFAIARTDIVRACRALKDAGWEHLSLITAIDWKDRWEIIYHIVKYGCPEVVVLRVELPYQDPSLPSITSVWKSADWHERETFDLMGILFEDHPDLRRILLPEDFEGFPLRKEVKYGNRS